MMILSWEGWTTEDLWKIRNVDVRDLSGLYSSLLHFNFRLRYQVRRYNMYFTDVIVYVHREDIA